MDERKIWQDYKEIEIMQHHSIRNKLLFKDLKDYKETSLKND